RPEIFRYELPRDYSGREEEQQLLRLDGDGCPFEEVSNQGQAAHEWNFGDVNVLRVDDDSANHDCAAIRNQHLGLRRLCVQRRDALYARDTLIDLRIFDEHVHEDGAFDGNLRRHFQLQHGVDELHR